LILEVAILNIRPGQTVEFEASFQKASTIIASIDGYISHSLKRCVEDVNKYMLLVNWETIESHTINFRKSEKYSEWKDLLHHFYDPFPAVEHFEYVA